MDIRTQLARFIAPLSNRIRMMLARAVIKAVNDDTNVQQLMVSLLAGELRDGVERFPNYGFDSCPHPDMEAFVGFIGGDRGNPVVLGIADRKFRIKGKQPGEVVIYTDEGDTIFLKRGHNIEINTENLTMNAKNIILNASTEVQINTETLTMDAQNIILNASNETQINTPATKISQDTKIAGALEVSGNIKGSGTVQDARGTMDAIRSTYNGHTHIESNAPGGSTTMPIQPMT